MIQLRTLHTGRAALANAVVEDEALRGDREPAFLRLRERRWLDSALREEGADIRSSVERVRVYVKVMWRPPVCI